MVSSIFVDCVQNFRGLILHAGFRLHESYQVFLSAIVELEFCCQEYISPSMMHTLT